ncbi:MAG: T9SS type A sorting domain-containing protein [Bacteroidota bacterium]
MRLYKFITATVLMGICLMSNNSISQETFASREELNGYIYENSDLESLTNGYLLELDPDFTPELQDSFFGAIENEVELNELLSYFKIMENADVSGDFEMDSTLFPVMDRLYANNGINPIAIPLFVCDIQFEHLDDVAYNEFINWSSTVPFPQLTQNDLDYKHEVMTGFFADTLVNQNIQFYWNDETYFTNTSRTIQDVYVVIDRDSIHLEKNRIYNLKEHFTGTLRSFDISIQFSDGTIENKRNRLFFTNTQEKNNCIELHHFDDTNSPWSSLGGFCNLGVDNIPTPESDFPLLNTNFSVLWGCGDLKVLDKPFIIVSGWGPYTDKGLINDAQGWPSSIQDVYWSYNQEGYIDNLVGAGFDVIIVKFFPPNQSVLKNSILLERLIKMVNQEKHANGSYEENIISGYSAGAMCVRLTLQRMEKEHLEGTNEHHHSKLYISYDGEHGGANIPLGMQHAVEHLEEYKNLVTTGTLQESLRIYALHYILNAPLSRELLKYFYTETGTSSIQTMGQDSHPDRDAYLQYHNWLNHSKNTHNPGYPAFTRNISISNGTSQSDINFPVYNHDPFPTQEGKLIFEHQRSQRKWEVSFLGNSAATPWVFKYEEKSWGQWDIVEEARVFQPLILDNAPGGTTFLAGKGEGGEPNTTYQVLRRMEKRATNLFNSDADFIDYEALYTFTPTIFTHDIRNFDPSTTGGRLDYDMKSEGLMYDNLMDADIGNPNDASSFFGYPHLAHPQDHCTNYTPFDAVFAWDKTNTVHIQSGEAEFDPNGNGGRGKWEQVNSPVRGVIKNFILNETDFYNAFIQNRRYGWNAKSSYIYKADIVARNEIYAGENVTQRTDFKPAEVQQNADISFTACKSVNLKPGFHAQGGSEFHAKVNDDVCSCGKAKSTGNASGNNEYNAKEATTVLSLEEKSVNSMEIRLYPNPGKGKVNLEIMDENVRRFDFFVYDLQGKEISNDSVEGKITTITLEKGVYIVKIKTNDQWHTKKLIMH